MSFLYSKRAKKVFKWVWIVIAALIALSMVVSTYFIGF